jgi:hypothetical protein
MMYGGDGDGGECEGNGEKRLGARKAFIIIREKKSCGRSQIYSQKREKTQMNKLVIKQKPPLEGKRKIDSESFVVLTCGKLSAKANMGKFYDRL